MSDMMNNIIEHPKTTVVGLLLGALQVFGALSSQGISLGEVGKGTVVQLAIAVATALLGMISKDPRTDISDSSNSTTKTGVVMLCAVLLMGTMSACSGAQVAQNIVNWTPALESAVATINSTESLLLPADARIFASATAGFDATADELVSQAKAYLATPNASVLARLQTAVVTFQQTVNSALLQAAKIVDPASQRHALASINAVAAIVLTILGLVQQVSSKASLAAMSSRAAIKLSSVEPYLDKRDIDVAVERYGMTADKALAYESSIGF